MGISGVGVRRVRCMPVCTLGMGVSLWGVSPLYVNPVSVSIHWHKYPVFSTGSGTPKDRLKAALVQRYEPTNRNSIQGRVSG